MTALAASRNLRIPVERDGKRLPQISTFNFLLLLVVGITFGAFVLVPLLFVYQVVWKTLLCNILWKRSCSPANCSTAAPGSKRKSVIPTPEDEVVVPREQRQYDVVVLGATGFTGTMAVQHLLHHYRGNNANSSITPQIRFAMAGRSLSKLQALHAQLKFEFEAQQQQAFSQEGGRTQNCNALVDILVVDTLIPAQVMALVQATKVVINFVGPFHLYGGSVVMEACAKYGTHYIDITAEVGWVKEMLTWSPDGNGITLHDIALKTGAKLINFCGHDCVPWDLTVFKLHELLQQQTGGGEELVHVQCWDEVFSSISGGTMATLMALVGNKDLVQIQRDLAASAESDPFLKLPNGAPTSARFREVVQWWIGKASKHLSNSLSPECSYTAPFFMAPVNAQLVKWSHVLRSGEQKMNKTGATLSYWEVVLYRDFASAYGTCFLLIIFVGVILLRGIPLVDYIVDNALPKSGEGPSVESQHLHYLFLVGQGTGSRGTVVETAIYFRKDPGYMDTSRMAVESGLCLVVPDSAAKIPSQSTGGFWTPSTGLGNVLLERLVNSGSVFDSQVIRKAED